MTESTDRRRSAAGWALRGPILIVDDERLLAAELAEMLDDAGIVAICAGSALEALDLLVEREDIAGVVTDLKMPDLNGLQLLRAMRERGHRHPVIIMSGHVDQGERDQALELEALCYLAKPCDICAIPGLLRRHFSDVRAADPGSDLGLPRSA